ncbi:putative holin-like toxin [Aquibacillus sediminis]|nr:putative holin-like toxin [Aquibacillus sediminis]
MTTYEAITVALQSNLVLVAVITVVIMIVSNRKK